jgi:peptide deformylase
VQVDVPEEFQHLFEQSAKRPVVKIPAPVLRQRCTEVGKIGPKTLKLIDEMTRVMKVARGIGLAAPQIGVGLRVIVIAPEGMKPVPMINPIITRRAGEMVGEEGCLSIPGLYGDVVRSKKVEVEALDRRGNTVVYELEDMPSRVVQHEIDHLDGVLFIDKVLPETVYWSDPEKPKQSGEVASD